EMRSGLRPFLDGPHDDVWIVGLPKSFDISCGPRLSRGSHDLHVLLRHRLLREAGGFEGFVWLSVRLEMDDLSVSERPYVGDVSFALNSGKPRRSSNSVDGDEAVTRADDSLQLNRHVLVRLDPALS